MEENRGAVRCFAACAERCRAPVAPGALQSWRKYRMQIFISVLADTTQLAFVGQEVRVYNFLRRETNKHTFCACSMKRPFSIEVSFLETERWQS